MLKKQWRRVTVNHLEGIREEDYVFADTFKEAILLFFFKEGMIIDDEDVQSVVDMYRQEGERSWVDEGNEELQYYIDNIPYLTVGELRIYTLDDVKALSDEDKLRVRHALEVLEVHGRTLVGKTK